MVDKEELMNEIREVLGLEDPWVFAVKAMRRNLSKDRENMKGSKQTHDDVHRATGRTTRVLLKALVELKLGKTVTFEAVTRQASRMFVEDLRGMAYALGLDTKKVLRPEVAATRDRSSVVWFTDHF